MASCTWWPSWTGIPTRRDYVLAWRVSNTLEADFCVKALEEALSKGTPEIFNTDQGSQFTSDAFTGVLFQQGIQISMDGKGRYMDNIFVERLWRSVKYEEVYLKAYRDVPEAKAAIGAYLRFYNEERPHQALDYQTPRQVFEAGCHLMMAMNGKRPATGKNQKGGVHRTRKCYHGHGLNPWH